MQYIFKYGINLFLEVVTSKGFAKVLQIWLNYWGVSQKYDIYNLRVAIILGGVPTFSVALNIFEKLT